MATLPFVWSPWCRLVFMVLDTTIAYNTKFTPLLWEGPFRVQLFPLEYFKIDRSKIKISCAKKYPGYMTNGFVLQVGLTCWSKNVLREPGFPCGRHNTLRTSIVGAQLSAE
jgi:hypothetical protein